MINVIIAIETATAIKLRDNFKLVDPQDPSQGYVRNDLNNAQRRKLRTHISGHWKGPTFQGTPYVIVSMYFPNDRVAADDPRLWWLEKFKQLLPGKEFVLGAWDRTGAQYGTRIIPAVKDYTDPENPVLVTPETVTGTPVYPIPNLVLNNPDQIFPDVDGIPATGPSEVNKILGWADRNWS